MAARKGVEWDAIPEALQHKRADDAINAVSELYAGPRATGNHQRQLRAVHLPGLEPDPAANVEVRLDYELQPGGALGFAPRTVGERGQPRGGTWLMQSAGAGCSQR